MNDFEFAFTGFLFGIMLGFLIMLLVVVQDGNAQEQLCDVIYEEYGLTTAYDENSAKCYVSDSEGILIPLDSYFGE